MGGMAGGKLAGAVCEAGGFGMIGVGLGHVNNLENFLQEQYPLAGASRVGVGFITWAQERQQDLIDMAIDLAPPAIMLSFGEPGSYMKRIRGAGILAICQVQTVQMARKVLAEGADIVIAQGTEAGGHAGQRSTFALVPAVADAASKENPDAIVAAAGGIADGRGLAAALMLGADGVLIGTRFAAATECLRVDDASKKRMLETTGDETLRSSVWDVVRDIPWPKEFTGRAIANAMSREWNDRQEELAQNVSAKARYAAAPSVGEIAYQTVWAGEALDMIHAIEPAGAIIERVVAEAKLALARTFD
jgi:nitronate monooxygenase